MATTNGSTSSGFLDRGTIIAVLVIGAMWWGWSVWFEKQYSTPAPQSVAVTPAEAPGQTPANQVSSGSNSKSNGAAGGAIVTSQTALQVGLPENRVPFATSAVTGELSSRGFRFSNMVVTNFQNRDGSPIRIGAEEGNGFLGVSVLVDQERIEVPFEIRADGNRFVGRGQLGGLVIDRTVIFEQPIEGESKQSRNGQTVRVQTVASGDLSQFKGFEFALADRVKPPETGSLFAPSYDFYDWFVKATDKQHRLIVDPEKFAPMDLANVLSFALSSHYFTFAVADQSPVRPALKLPVPVAKDQALVATGSVVYPMLSKGDRFQVDQTVFIGAKDVDLLRAADKNLETVVDYGIFAVLAEPLLWLMRFFYGFFGNWGLAIIGLTLVVRLLVLPLNISSFKSMKAMQRIQPQMQAVREKFKNDPRRMNEEVMRLMKENKANPLGGCFPMLLQMPVFFALYQVLGQSVELYRQPFVFWIQDLTVKDPYYVLPVLMGVAMFGHQKLTPVADPQQAKIMMWIPVIMPLFMLALPSGLTLYILLSTAFGVGQQMVLMRDKDKTTNPAPAKVAKA